MMKKTPLLTAVLLLVLASCKSNTYQEGDPLYHGAVYNSDQSGLEEVIPPKDLTPIVHPEAEVQYTTAPDNLMTTHASHGHAWFEDQAQE